jgi:hypothetical protein
MKSGTHCYTLQDDLEFRVQMCYECLQQHILDGKAWPEGIDVFPSDIASIKQRRPGQDESEVARNTYAVPGDTIGSTSTLRLRDVLHMKGCLLALRSLAKYNIWLPEDDIPLAVEWFRMATTQA